MMIFALSLIVVLACAAVLLKRDEPKLDATPRAATCTSGCDVHVRKIDGAWFWQRLDAAGRYVGQPVGPFATAIGAGIAAPKDGHRD